MSDPERELTPEQEADVRRLLGEARATEPLPSDVAARLDSVLIGLHQERGGLPPSVHRIAPVGRRRRATALLVAAAAVVAVGIGLGQLTETNSADDGGANGALDTTAERAPDAASGGSDSGEPSDGLPVEPEAAGPDTDSSAPPTPTPVGRIRESSFTADANQLRRAIPDGAPDGEFAQLRAEQLPARYVLAGRPFDCAPAPWGDGVLVPVLVGDVPAVLAYRPAMGESQIVDLLACGTADKLRTTTLQAG